MNFTLVSISGGETNSNVKPHVKQIISPLIPRKIEPNIAGVVTVGAISVKEQCVVVYPYQAINDDELSLAEGQVVTIVSKDVEDKG